MIKASDYIVSFLIEQKIPYVFGYIGGMITHLVDSLYRFNNIEMVNAIQEQGAGFAADGYARVTGKTAVIVSTSGPGATNLLTPLADCFFDSIPAVFITGNVNTFDPFLSDKVLVKKSESLFFRNGKFEMGGRRTGSPTKRQSCLYPSSRNGIQIG